MTDGLRKSHLRKAPQVGLSEVGLPEGNRYINSNFQQAKKIILKWKIISVNKWEKKILKTDFN